MAKHAAQKEQKMRDAAKKFLQKAFTDGLRQGTFAVSKVIYDKALNPNKTPEEKISDIIQFCQKAFPDSIELDAGCEES